MYPMERCGVLSESRSVLNILDFLGGGKYLNRLLAIILIAYVYAGYCYTKICAWYTKISDIGTYTTSVWSMQRTVLPS